MAPSADSLCPICQRYIGPVSSCPYCDANSGKSPLLKWLRIIALLIGIGGVGLLYLTARHKEIPVVLIADISPTMNYAYVRIAGTVSERPYVGRDNSKVSFVVDDGTGTIRVEARGRVSRALAEQDGIPRAKSDVEIIGCLRATADRDPKLYVRSADHVGITPHTAP